MLWRRIKETLHFFDIVNHKYVPHILVHTFTHIHMLYSTRSWTLSKLWTVFHLDFVFSIFCFFTFLFQFSVERSHVLSAQISLKMYTLLAHTHDLLLFRKTMCCMCATLSWICTWNICIAMFTFLVHSLYTILYTILYCLLLFCSIWVVVLFDYLSLVRLLVRLFVFNGEFPNYKFALQYNLTPNTHTCTI